jgi:gamma-glutamylcyclotransferase (GGCT)/AIG2-like uncharacterized protein YtfP
MTAHPPPVTDRALPLLLAVYGTLRRGCRNHHVLAGSAHVADGHVRGLLHEVTTPRGRGYSYPLLVVPGTDDAAPGETPVPGPVVVEVYRVVDPGVLADLDVLEDYDPDDPAASEYVRVLVPLLGADAATTGTSDPVEVQTYAYAGAGERTGVGTLIRTGDWRAHAGEAA